MNAARFLQVRSPTLLVTLVVLLVAYPRLDGISPPWVLSLLTTFVLASAVYTASTTRRHLVISLVLGTPAVLARLVLQQDSLGTIASNVLQLLFLGYVCAILLGFVLRQGHVRVEKLSAAASLYLLMGLMWVLLYRIVEIRHPGSFSVPDGGDPTYGDLLYFSYVTLTTLGYGDITPTNDYARSLAMLEAIAGSFFMAVLVARLVSLYKRGEAPPAES